MRRLPPKVVAVADVGDLQVMTVLSWGLPAPEAVADAAGDMAVDAGPVPAALDLAMRQFRMQSNIKKVLMGE